MVHAESTIRRTAAVLTVAVVIFLACLSISTKTPSGQLPLIRRSLTPPCAVRMMSSGFLNPLAVVPAQTHGAKRRGRRSLKESVV